MKTQDLLREALQAAVPLWIDNVRHWPNSLRLSRAQICAQHIAAHGDRILFKAKPGETAEAFNRLAEALACAAYQPGGITVMGLHFEAKAEGAGS